MAAPLDSASTESPVLGRERSSCGVGGSMATVGGRARPDAEHAPATGGADERWDEGSDSGSSAVAYSPEGQVRR